MKSTRTYLYIGIFAALLIAAYFITSDRGEKTTSYKLKETKLFELDSVKTDRIEIVNNGAKIVLSKATGEWRMTEPRDYRTVSSHVENAVSNLANMKLESIVSKNPEKQDSYGFDESNKAVITVFASGNKVSEFLLGNSASLTASYVKKPDSENIYIAENFDRNNLVKLDPNEWLDKNILSIPKQSVNSISWTMPGESFTAEKNEAGNFYIGTDSAGKNFDGILNLLERLQTTGFSDTTLSDQTEFTSKVIIDTGTKTELNFLKLDTTPVKYLLTISGDKQIYEVEESYVNNLLKSRKDLLQ
ncbi:MAG: DUF4340 domain-containing protein [Ignavibacteria bacterium]|nr:DUF4340 domain-containing protein [Ignavibacteria bacterium]